MSITNLMVLFTSLGRSDDEAESRHRKVVVASNEDAAEVTRLDLPALTSTSSPAACLLICFVDAFLWSGEKLGAVYNRITLAFGAR
jgi:hypothetical protein